MQVAFLIMKYRLGRGAKIGRIPDGGPARQDHFELRRRPPTDPPAAARHYRRLSDRPDERAYRLVTAFNTNQSVIDQFLSIACEA